VLCAAIQNAAWGQANQGSIAGNVTDTSGASVAGAKISVKNVATGAVYETVSSSAGTYRLPNLSVGSYDVTAGLTGFKTAVLKSVVVEVGTTSALDIQLQVGAATESVEVLADAPTVQSESADIGTDVSTKQVLDLPLALGSVVQAMRSPEAFVFLTPGTVGPGTANGNGGTFESKISGGQNYGTEVLLDGASTYRSENGSSFDETAPSVDALGEYKVITSTIPAEFGHTTGGIESFNTRAGTNSFHGSAYDIFRNEDLDANTFFNNFNGLPRNLDKQNDYGLTFAGPAWIPKVYNGHDKTFFMFAWEQYRQTRGGVSNISVPTAAERGGDFSAYLTNVTLGINPCDGTPIFQGQIFDPATTQTVAGTQCRTAFQGNKIPQSHWSTAGQNILSHYPAPQNSNQSLNFVYPFSFPILDTTTTVRVDQNVSTQQKVYFTYSSRDNGRISTNPNFNDPAGQGRFQDFFTHYIRVGWDYAIQPTMLNHLNLGYNRTNSKNVGAGVASGINWALKLGISGTAGNETKGTPFPTIGLNDNYRLNDIGDEVYGDTIDNGYRINESVEKLTGKHDYKFGVDYRFQLYSPLSFGRTTGQYFFWGTQTAATVALSNNTATGNAVASLLVGQVHDSNLYDYSGQPHEVSKYYALFFQDSYKVTRALTLSLGLRWDVEVPRYETHGNTSNIGLTAPNPGADNFPGALVFAGAGTGRNGRVQEQWANTWYKDFGPRIGFAYSPERFGHKTVLRGGIGIIYGALLYADFGAFNRVGFTGNPGFTSLDGFSPAFSLDSGFPSYTPPPNLNPAQLNYQGGVQYIDPTFGRPAMVNNWSLEVQHELATDLILDVAYVGQHSTHLHTNFDSWNSLNPKYFSMGSNLLTSQIGSLAAQAAGIQKPYPSFPSNLLVAQALVPLPQYFNFNTDGALENWGQSRYDALQASLHRRFRNGLNLMASYTWSKTLTDADAALPFFATLHGGGSAQNPFDKKGEKAISNQDVPQTLVLSYVYELPIGKGKKLLDKGGVINKVVGGWQIGGIQRYQSGQPLSFCCGAGVPAFSGAIRFNRVKTQSLWSPAWQSGSFNPTSDRMFNPSAFSDPNAQCGTPAGCSSYAFGDMSRTTGEVRMYKFLSEDFSFIKRTPLTERTNLTFNLNMLDAFNRHIFNRPYDLNPLDGNFGKLDTSSTVLGPRIVQLQLKLEF